jgi:hypothetical protein
VLQEQFFELRVGIHVGIAAPGMETCALGEMH